MMMVHDNHPRHHQGKMISSVEKKLETRRFKKNKRRNNNKQSTSRQLSIEADLSWDTYILPQPLSNSSIDIISTISKSTVGPTCGVRNPVIEFINYPKLVECLLFQLNQDNTGWLLSFGLVNKRTHSLVKDFFWRVTLPNLLGVLGNMGYQNIVNEPWCCECVHSDGSKTLCTYKL